MLENSAHRESAVDPKNSLCLALSCHQMSRAVVSLEPRSASSVSPACPAPGEALSSACPWTQAKTQVLSGCWPTAKAMTSWGPVYPVPCKPSSGLNSICPVIWDHDWPSSTPLPLLIENWLCYYSEHFLHRESLPDSSPSP